LFLPHQPSGTVVDWNLMAPHEIRRHVGLNGMETHHFLDGIMQGEVDIIDLHDPRKPVGKVAKELIEVPLRGDRLHDFEERLVALLEILTGR
jgi:hypothetical protein